MPLDFNKWENAQILGAPKTIPGTSPQKEEDEMGFWGVVGDIAAAPFRGIEGAVQGVYNLADYATFDLLPDYDNRLLGNSSTMVGGLVEGISQFAIPFGFALKGASAVGKLAGASKALTAAEKAVGAGRGAAAISKGRELGKYAVAGAMTDFAVFDAHEARLSDLIQMAPSLQNPITEYLASDENDSEIEGRLKNAVEGLGIGGLVDVFMQGIRGFRSGMKAKAQGKSPEEVMQAVQDGVVGMRDYEKVVEGREYTSSVAKALNIEEDQASGVVSLIDSLGLDRKSIQFERHDPLVDKGYAKFDDTLVDTRTTQGLVQFKEDGTAIITGFRNADVSTGIHEVSHVARRWLLNRNIPEQARRGISEEELTKVEKWAGVGENGWTRSAEEKFARGFEKYIRDGKSPTKGLQGLFTKLGGWMRDIYQDVSGSQIDVEINPEIREVMDRLVTRQGLPSRPAPGSVRSLAQGQEERNTFTFTYYVKEIPTYVDDYKEDGTRYSRKIEGGRRRDSVIIEARTEEEAKKIFNQRKKTGEFTQYDMDRRGTGGHEYPKPRVSIAQITDDGPSTLLQGGDDPHSLRRMIEETDPESVPTPREGGVANPKFASTDEGARRVFAAEAVRNKETLKKEGEQSLEEGAAAGIARAPAELNNAIDAYSDITGDGTFKALKGKLNENEEHFQETLDTLTTARTVLSSLGGKIYEVAIKGAGASDQDVAEFLRMEGVFNLYQHHAVNMARAVARKLVGQKYAPPVDIPRDVLPEEVVTGTKGGDAPAGRGGEDEGLGPGRGPGEGEGLGPGRGPGEGGEGVPSDRTRDVSQARREVIEAVGDGDYEVGLHRVRDRMQKYVEAYDPSNPGRAMKLFRKKNNALISYWMNSILSGPSTHIVNVASGLVTSLYLPMERAFGDVLQKAWEDKTVDLSPLADLVSTYSSMVQAAPEALKAARKAFKEGENILDPHARAMEYRGQSPALDIDPDSDSMVKAAMKWASRGMNKGLDNKITTTPSRLLTMEDEFFKQLNYRTHLRKNLMNKAQTDPKLRMKTRQEQAEWVQGQFDRAVENDQMYAESLTLKRATDKALEEGLSPNTPEFKKRVLQLNEQYWDPSLGRMAEQAREVARSSTFTTPLSKGRGGVVGASKMINEMVNKYPGLRFVIPFVRTPTNLLKFFLDRSPLAVKQRFEADFKKAYDRDPEVRADWYGRMAMGSVMFVGMSGLAASGRITGSGPDNRHERDALIRSGWQPYSFKDPVTGGWVSYRRLDPFATFFGLVADLHETAAYAASNNDQDALSKLEGLVSALPMAIGRNIASKSYLTGLQRAFEVVSNPSRGGEALIQQFAASFVPAAISQTGTAFGEGDLREINGVLDAIKSRIPGISATLDPRRNFLGQTVKHPGQGELYNPFTYMTGGGSFLAKEIAKVGHGFMPPNSLKNGVDLKDYANREGQSAYDRWMELQGTVKLSGRTLEKELTRLFKSSAYKRLPEDTIENIDKSPRIGAINRVVNKYRAKAFRKMLREFPEVQRRDEIGALIRQQRRSGRTSSISQLLALIEDQ